MQGSPPPIPPFPPIPPTPAKPGIPPFPPLPPLGAAPPRADASMTELVTHLAHETRRYVELQIELAKMQALQGLAGGLYDAAKIAVAAALFGLAGLCLVIALAIGMSVLLDSYWLGVLLTGVVLLIMGAVVLWFALGTSFLLNVIPKDLLRQVRILSRGPRE